MTPFYNQGDNGEKPARGGVGRARRLTATRKAQSATSGGYRAFAGQRDDGFYADIQSISISTSGSAGRTSRSTARAASTSTHRRSIFRSRSLAATTDGRRLCDDRAAATTRSARDGKGARRTRRRRSRGRAIPCSSRRWWRSAEPISTTGRPRERRKLFAKYALNPEFATVLGLPIIPGLAGHLHPGPDQGRPDHTAGAPGGRSGFPPARRVRRRHSEQLRRRWRFIPGGWPNGRRFGDDVVDIALIALGPGPTARRRVTANDITYNQVFPYAATPLNGRNHGHH